MSTQFNYDQTLFETYKLHAELAEHVAAQREGLNKLYSGMLISLAAASILIYRVAPSANMIWALPTLGILISFAWIFSIYSITGRLYAKHTVLLDLEKKLPFKFLSREQAVFKSHCFIKRKYSATLMPGAFLVLCAVWLLILFCLEKG